MLIEGRRWPYREKKQKLVGKERRGAVEGRREPPTGKRPNRTSRPAPKRKGSSRKRSGKGDVQAQGKNSFGVLFRPCYRQQPFKEENVKEESKNGENERPVLPF